jgi:hypothetical protein
MKIYDFLINYFCFIFFYLVKWLFLIK